MNRLWLVSVGLAIGSAAAEIVFLGLGESMSRADMFVWPTIVLGWVFIALMKDRTLHHNRKTIEFQAKTIRNQAELISQILASYDGGRE